MRDRRLFSVVNLKGYTMNRLSKIAATVGRYVFALASLLLLASALVPELTATVVAHATPSLSPLYNAFAAHVMGAGRGVSLAILAPVLQMVPQSYQALAAATQPSADQPEYFPMVWFDTITFTSASTTGTQNFFSTTNSDNSLSNMQLAGQFPANEYFQLGEIHVDVLERTTAETADAANTAAVGAMDDLYQVMASSRALVQITYRNKPYGPVPLACCRPLGLLQPNVAGAFAAATAVQFGGWNAAGWTFGKTLTFGPSSKFGVQIIFPSTLTLSQATVQIRVGLRGQHNRTVN